MEPDFIQLGRGLTALHRGATDLGQVASGLIAAVRKTLQESRLAGESGLVTAALRELHDNLSVSQQRLQTLAAMSATLRQLRQQGHVVGRTALLLKSSGCNFAVESARSVECQQAFGDFVPSLRQLADQVGALGENITDEAERTQSEQELLVRSITSSLTELHQLAERSSSAVATASEHIQSMMDSSASVVEQAEQRATAIRRHSEDAAYFLQFGDIVRQKLEHVVDALATVAGSHHSTVQLGALDRLIAIQTGQLEAIRTEALTARDKLAAAFNGLADETTHLVDDIFNLAQHKNARDESLDNSNRLQNLSADILQLQTLHARGYELGVQSQGTAQRAADASAKLAGHLSSINTLNFELRLQALNAIVKTARLGSDGATLGVLSAHVHEVSHDSGQSVAAILKLLDSLRSGTALLGQGSQPIAADNKTGESALERGLRDIADLHQKFHQTSGEASSLAERQKEVLAETSANLDFLSAFNLRMTAMIEELHAARACLAPHVSSLDATSDKEAELAVAYTMESEREIHRRVVGKPKSALTAARSTNSSVDNATGNPPASPPTSLATENTLCSAPAPEANDNVEFF
jgi:methyl-accepting chemotaxis protein